MSVLRAIAFLLAVCVAACARTPDAQAIRESIENAAAAAQSHDAAALTDVLADDFIGNDEFDKAALKSRLRGQFVIAKAVGVRVGLIDVEVSGDRATARFDAFVTDTSGRWIPDRAATLHFETGWRREGKRWLCINARWSNDSR